MNKFKNNLICCHRTEVQSHSELVVASSLKKELLQMAPGLLMCSRNKKDQQWSLEETENNRLPSVIAYLLIASFM